jgi:hypothetical protein
MSREDSVSEPVRRGLREIAATDAPDLLVQARERARVRAQALIEDALVEELVAAAARLRSEPPAPARKAPASTPPPSESPQVWWTYCVASAADFPAAPVELQGVEPDTYVQVVREGPLAALVSPVPASEYGDERLREHLEDLGWLERTARRHEAVLETVLHDVTIVPLRLCTLYRDLEGVRGLLRNYVRTLSDGLNLVEGCTEWGVKVFAEAGAGAGVPEPAEETTDRSGAAYLKQRQHERALAERAGEVRAKCAEVIHHRMSELARESASNPPQRPELHGRDLSMLLNGAYLVERRREDELARSVEVLREEWEPLGFVIELTGPWPPYNFVSEATGVMP